MGKHLAPRCPECDIQLRLFICGRGAVVDTMVFTLGYCPNCDEQYDAWCSSKGLWFYRNDPQLRFDEMAFERAVKLTPPWEILDDYAPE